VADLVGQIGVVVPFAGERFSSEVTLTPAAVAAYARAAGDSNPIHHDPEITRFSASTPGR